MVQINKQTKPSRELRLNKTVQHPILSALFIQEEAPEIDNICIVMTYIQRKLLTPMMRLHTTELKYCMCCCGALKTPNRCNKGSTPTFILCWYNTSFQWSMTVRHFVAEWNQTLHIHVQRFTISVFHFLNTNCLALSFGLVKYYWCDTDMCPLPDNNCFVLN